MIAFFTEDSAVIQIRGRLDGPGGTALGQTLDTIPPVQYPHWVLDLSQVEFIDSAGLTALLDGLSLANEHGCQLAIYNPHPAVKLVFEISRLDELFLLVDTIDQQEPFAQDLDRNAA
jgi:anti-anti-sigma factor